MVEWIDNADSWICPVCGNEVNNPARYPGCRCPKCGFQADKDGGVRPINATNLKRYVQGLDTSLPYDEQSKEDVIRQVCCIIDNWPTLAPPALERVKVVADAYSAYFNSLSSKPDCNTCENKGCGYTPRWGNTVRVNCPLYRGPEKEGNK